MRVSLLFSLTTPSHSRVEGVNHDFQTHPSTPLFPMSVQFLSFISGCFFFFKFRVGFFWWGGNVLLTWE